VTPRAVKRLRIYEIRGSGQGSGQGAVPGLNA